MGFVDAKMSRLGRQVRIGGATLDAERGVMHRADGGATTLRAKTLDLLLLLLRNAGSVVSRAAILDAIWAEVHVTDDSITQCIVELRRALGPDAALLRTVQRRGYLLDVPPPGAPQAPALVPGAALPSGAPVVAVMPFRRLAPDPELALFGHGVLEGVVGALATLRAPVVISANTTLHLAPEETDPRAIGARLGAGYVASGTLRRAGGRIRLTVELADARSAAVLWQRPYDIHEGEGFDTQDRIAAVIAHTLAPRVQEAELSRSQRQRPADLGAYHLLLMARRMMFRMERGEFEQAGVLLARAAALDPGFATTHAERAAWHGLRVGQGWSEDREAETRALEAALDDALARDGTNPRALAMLGHNHTILRRRYDDALAAFDRALDAAPNDAEAWLWSGPTHAFLGDGREAVRRVERAMALSPDDPLAFRFEHFRAIAHYGAGEMEAAAEWGLRSVRSNPRYTSNLRLTAAALVEVGRQAEAQSLAGQVMALEPGFRVAPQNARHPFVDDRVRRRLGEQLIAAGLPA